MAAAAKRKSKQSLLGVVTRVADEVRAVHNIVATAKHERKQIYRSAARRRKRVLDAVFKRTDLISLQVTFNAWREWNAIHGFDRRKETFLEAAAHKQLADESHIKALEEEAAELRNRIKYYRSQEEEIAEAKKERDQALSRCNQLQAIVDHMSEVALRVTEAGVAVPKACSSEEEIAGIGSAHAPSIYKAGLHQLLSDIDPRYMPPSNCVTLREVTDRQKRILANQRLTESDRGSLRVNAEAHSSIDQQRLTESERREDLLMGSQVAAVSEAANDMRRSEVQAVAEEHENALGEIKLQHSELQQLQAELVRAADIEGSLRDEEVVSFSRILDTPEGEQEIVEERDSRSQSSVCSFTAGRKGVSSNGE